VKSNKPISDSVLFVLKKLGAKLIPIELPKQSVEGGMPQTLPLPYGELASFSPDGNRIAFQIISTEFRTWKRYRGGMASDIWLYDFANNTSEKITDFEGTDAVPMWHENTIYFMSDRDQYKKLNI
jgi:tricorn protease